MAQRRTTDRRTYLRTVGGAGAAGLAGLAGCLGQPGTDGGGTGTDGGGTATGAGREITAGTAPGFPPFEIKEGGELTGFDVELLEAVVGETDYTLAGWSEFEFDSLIPALTSGQIDVIAAAMTITEERQGTIAFSDPYWSANQAIVVRDGEDFSPSSLSDLSGRAVGAQRGTTGEGVVQDQLIAEGVISESDYRAFDNYVFAVQSLENGDVDAVVVDEPVAQTFADQRDVRVAFVYETGEEYGFGLRQDDDAPLSAINEGLQAVRDSGRYEELRNEWFADA
ncbi:MAG TPA: basic amino acid ABC transporter substrate-binding protein [Halobacteriales archaeon]|nr:basic amino acid ABC transporter substrate-binding protein [Halobacteriales archaeon]